ncbi:hypothetical protein LSCM1_06503 [Leishmania martiniquensis]|uniref:Uncharacterized protein n=1 Tax=Leishmania martiniquensis TaxID=1580590 RepID=A0A836HEV0_9TRYP|nr:hypothetical protein LSCM1_06503 [Leishmania martiniquensis]
MRVLRCGSAVVPGRALAAATAVSQLRWTADEARAQVPRSCVLARWTGAGAKAADANRSLLGKGMSFASGLLRDASPSTRSASTNAAIGSTVGDVLWDLCERMDYYVQYNIPSSWRVTELLRDNSIAIQCSPPPPIEATEGSGAAVHGISLNCFAYKQRVKQADSVRLLHVFLKRFNASVNNSLEVLSEGHPPLPSPAEMRRAVNGTSGGALHAGMAASTQAGGAGAEEGTCEMLAKQLNSAVAEVTFTPGPGQPLAHGLCRAFYNSNGRFHYVIIVAVPEEEYANSLDLMIHALVSVVESRVEAAARRT